MKMNGLNQKDRIMIVVRRLSGAFVHWLVFVVLSLFLCGCGSQQKQYQITNKINNENKSVLSCTKGNVLIWQKEINPMYTQLLIVEDGIILYPYNNEQSGLSDEGTEHLYSITKYDFSGKQLWEKDVLPHNQKMNGCYIIQKHDQSLLLFANIRFPEENSRHFLSLHLDKDGNVLGSYRDEKDGGFKVSDVIEWSDGFLIYIQHGDSQTYDFYCFNDTSGVTRADYIKTENSYLYPVSLLQWNGNRYLSAICLDLPEKEEGNRETIMEKIGELDDNNCITEICKKEYKAVLFEIDSLWNWVERENVEGAVALDLSANPETALFWSVGVITDAGIIPDSIKENLEIHTQIKRYVFETDGAAKIYESEESKVIIR